jgi:hypothetical protein
VKSTPQEPVSMIPPWVFPFSRYFHLLVDLFAPWMDLEFLQCIVSIHVLVYPLAISHGIVG